MAGTVVVDGFQKLGKVHRDIPKDRWPRREKR